MMETIMFQLTLIGVVLFVLLLVILAKLDGISEKLKKPDKEEKDE